VGGVVGAPQGSRLMEAASRPRPQSDPFDVLRAFQGLRRSLALYPPGHRIITKSVDELSRALERTAPDSGLVRIQLLSGVAHLDGRPFRTASRAHADLVSEWAAIGVDCLEIAADAGADALIEAARSVEGPAARPSARGPDTGGREAVGAGPIRLTRLAPVETRLPAYEWPDAPASVQAASYASTLDLARETVGVAFAGHALRADGVDALLDKISGELLDDSFAIAEILAIKRYENHTFCHSVHVGALAILLARRIGLSRERIAVLGEAALLHDIGKRQIPVEILRKPGKLTRRERRIVERHPVFGAEFLAGTPGLGELSATVALEHHRHFGGGGYPDLGGRVPHEASQVIAVVDVYEALTGARPYREPLSPDKACLILARMAGEQLNPALVRAFVGLISFFPIGSVVRTTRGEVGVVIRTHADDPLHPQIEVLSPELDPTGRRIDLSERDERGRYARHVAETLRHEVVQTEFVAPAGA